jgi:hypothetical protein
MSTRTNSGRRLVNVASTFLTGLLLLAAVTPALDAQATDARWQAWLGCWTPPDPVVRVVGAALPSHVVCVVPTSSTSAVDIATVENGRIVDRQRMDTDGARHPATRDGCTGWESAQWSTGNRRVFVRSEFSCAGGLTRSSSGVLAINGLGQWLDVQGVSSGGNKGVRVVRYRESTETGALSGEIAEALAGRGMPVSAARVSAAAPLTIADIVEASHRLDAGVVEAWLVEFNAGAGMKPGALNAKQLAALADEGVPDGVIDVIVALAYPKVFALNPATREGEFRAGEGGQRAGGMSRGIGGFPVIGYDAYGYPIYAADSWMRNGACAGYGFSSSYYSGFGCSPYCLGYYGVSSFDCSRYGYSRYGLYGYNSFGYGGYGYGGYGYGPGYGWYPGSQPVIIVVKGPEPSGTEQPHGRVVKGRGYTQGESATTSTPKSSTTSGSGSSGSSSSSGGGSSAGSGSAGSSAGRTAVPKKP